MVKLISVSAVKTEKTRTDGKVSRQYYTAIFGDALNPFAATRQRNIFQDHNSDGTTAFWKSGSPELVKQFVGKEIPGQIVNCTVESYSIGERMANSYTIVLLDGENKASILKQAGHVEVKPATAIKAEVKTVNASEALNG